MNRVLDVGYTLNLSGKEFIIKDIIGKGASSVTYLAEHGKTEHILKECNPLGIGMYRNETGELVADTDLSKQKFEECLVRFKDGANKQLLFRLTEDGKNSTSNIQDIHYANGTAYIDMTYFRGKTYDKVDSESLYDLFRRMKALAQVVGHYHKSGFLHLDIKPQNIYTIPETPEMVMMFDFDSVTPIKDIDAIISSSYTDVWAAPEQKMPKYRSQICEATDLFAIGEIIFFRLFGKHSEEKDRYSFSQYEYSAENIWFKNVNPRVFPMITDLLRGTLSCSVKKRYQNAKELVSSLDKLITITNPEKQFIISSNIISKDGFIGRDAEIQDIHSSLQQNSILFLHGIGGIGKSELAKQYANKYSSEYDTILFAPYITDIVSLIANDTSIQINNFSCATNEAVEEYYERKLQKLKELIANNRDHTLLIVDNLNSDKDKNIRILFELGCRVLITSRPDMGTIFKRPQMEIAAFSNKSDSRELFRQYYEFSNDESADVDAIISLVQGHTLAIELIAKQINAEWSTIQEIREKIENGGLSSIGGEEIDSSKDDISTQNSAFGHIKTLFDLSVFEQDNRANELYVLANLSLIPFTGIERQLFAEWCDLNNHGGKSCVNRLIKSGWIRLEESCISLHPLVSEVAIGHAQLSPDKWESYLTNLEEALFSWLEFPIDKKCKIEELAYSVFVSFCRISAATESIAVILKDIATFFAQCLYKYELAVVAMETANLKRLAYQDTDISFEAAIYNDLGVIYDNLGKIKEDSELINIAIQFYEKCLKLYERFDAEIINIAKTYQSLGCAYDNIKRHDIAEEYFDKAIHIINKKIQCDGKTSEEVDELTTIYCNLAFHYKELGSFDEAFDNLKTALAYASLVDMNSERVAKIYHDMASIILCNEFGNIEDAERFARQSFKIRSALFPSESYYLAMSKYILARALIRKGGCDRLSEAKSLLSVIIPIYIQTLGENNTDVKQLCELLASLP